MATPATLTHTTRRKALVADVLLFSVAIFWGSNFVFIKSVVQRTSALAGGSIAAFSVSSIPASSATATAAS